MGKKTDMMKVLARKHSISPCLDRNIVRIGQTMHKLTNNQVIILCPEYINKKYPL